MKKIVYILLGSLTLAGPVTAGEEWLPVREISLELKPGSPLDFSTFLPNPPIDETMRLQIDGRGHLARADAPGQPIRFLCASLAWSPASGGFPDHEAADRYAAQLRMHGYNIARFHYADAALMFGRKKDFDFDPEVFDRIHYLMAALKKNGLYWIVDGLTSPRGAYGGFDDRWELAGDLKLGVQIDDGDFEHWLRFQKLFLKTVNPYTGVAPIDDPALAAIIPMNENGVEFDAILNENKRKSAYSSRLQPLFNAWLKARYGSTENLAAQWGNQQWGDQKWGVYKWGLQKWAALSSGKSLENGSLSLPTRRSEVSPRMRDWQSFLIHLEKDSAARMTRALRDLGFNGLIAPYNNWPSLQTNLSRQDQQAIAMNAYQDWVGSYEPGTTIQGTSSLQDLLLYLRWIGASRWLGRPFLVTEYDHLFWSPYRYEAGLAAPAFAGLQDWDVLCRHGHGPILLAYGENAPHKQQMLPYAIALDPVARAGETLAALLFRRADVAPAPFAIPFLIDGEKGLTQSVNDREPEKLTRLALLAQIGLQDVATAKETPSIPADRKAASAEAVVDALKAAGRIPGEALEDIESGRIESATGELRIDAAKKMMILRTPRSVGAVFARLDRPLTLGVVTLKSASSGGLFALSSLDGQPIPQSRRLMAILTSDARNSGMRFADDRERSIADFGHLPVRIRRMEAEFVMDGGERWRLSPVGLDGVVRQQSRTAEAGQAIALSTDAPEGPTVYFLLERL